MMLPEAVRIFVCTAPTDMRRSFDGLAAAVRRQLELDPESGALFLFINRRANRAKLMWWDRTGYCLLYKRLEWGYFRRPLSLEPNGSHVTIDAVELAKILEGVGLPPLKHRLRRQAVEENARQALHS
jgi:transposase